MAEMNDEVTFRCHVLTRQNGNGSVFSLACYTNALIRNGQFINFGRQYKVILAQSSDGMCPNLDRSILVPFQMNI
eukprot:scaffold925_cov129-Cylindrotheca_fusiformis.AAC.42